MGRRLNVSTPTVINTELVPLDESFYLDVDGQMEQWYYDNTEQYAPNRKVTPLLLVPVISAFDKDTNTSYTPAFNTTQWFANEWNEAQGKYVETEITNQVDSGSADYVIQGNNLLVKKNVSYSHAVTIRCVATYIDPRDGGVTYTVEDSVNLTTNRTADVVFPEVDIISPSGRAYNPLVDDENSQYDFKGVTTNNPVQPLNTDVRRYSVDVDGTEEILNSGEAVAPIMDIRYGNNLTSENQEFMYRQTAGGTLVGESIDKAFIERIKGNTVAWNQMIQNGDFSDGINGWSAYSNASAIAAPTWDNGRLKVTCISATTGGDAVMIQTGVPQSIIGHKYFLMFNFEAISSGITGPSYEGVVVATEIRSLSGNRYGAIITAARNTVNFYLKAVGSKSTGDIWYFDNVIFIDLTLIYGAGNEPATPEEFEADYERWFGKPLSYEEYDAGSLRPVLMQSVKTTGFNQWDEEWENGDLAFADARELGSNSWIRSIGYIKCSPNKEYYMKNSSGSNVYFFDHNRTYIGETTGLIRNCQNRVFTTPPLCHFMRFASYTSTYNHDICINISNPSKNGTYEPYEEKVQGFDVTAIKGKLDGAGESITIFPDGLKKAGNIQDEIFVEDGVVKAIKRVGSVDMGSLNWAPKAGATSRFYTWDIRDDIAYFEGTEVSNIICHRYITDNVTRVYNSNVQDKAICSNGFLGIADSQFTSDTELTQSLYGVYLYYELATPETYILDPITDFVWYGIKNGQEVLADTLPWYVSGQGTDNLVVDAMYGENINVVLRCKMMDGETLSPSKAYATLNWRTPDIEAFVQSDNGGAVRSDTEDMTFDTIVNVNGAILSDALKQKHLAFNWKIRKNNISTEIDKGWGQRITIDASELRNVKGSGSTLASTLVGNEVYLLGAYEEVTDDNEVVTDDGQVVFDRPVN